MMKRVILGLVLCFCAGLTANAQKDNENANKYLDYNYDKKAVKERKVVPYPPLREADVIYAKRVERVIDTREKKNMVMNWPKNPLNRVLYNLVSSGADKKGFGKLKAYRTDSLDVAMSIEDVSKLGGFCETISIQDERYPDDPYATIDSLVCTPFDYSQIKRYQISEEWIFDKQRGMFFPRIISIAPLYKPNVGGIEMNEMPMFYVNFEELRPILVNEEVFNRQNDAMRLTYYDFFEQRLFSSYLTKESNDKDLSINAFPEFKDNPMEALYESERIREDLFNWEHDLWEY
ncbi:MAG: type IX secretion system ring subunit PorN/GldN [Bacteroidia bacterium]